MIEHRNNLNYCNQNEPKKTKDKSDDTKANYF